MIPEKSVMTAQPQIARPHSISSEVLWGRAVESCRDPMYYMYIADARGEDEVALDAGTTLSCSNVRLKTPNYAQMNIKEKGFKTR